MSFKLLYVLNDMKKRSRFNDWLNQEIDFGDYTVKNRNVLGYLIKDIKKVIEEKNYHINDEKEFKNNLATFIYNNSKINNRK